MSRINKVAALLRADRINLNIQSTEKNAALREVATQLTGNVTNFDAFFTEILERERVSNTALEYGIAIPHARTEQCSEILIAIGRNANGISFGGKDGQTVKLIFLIGTPKQMVTEYLRVVGNLARLLRQEALREKLVTASDAATFIKLMDQAEG